MLTPATYGTKYLAHAYTNYIRHQIYGTCLLNTCATCARNKIMLKFLPHGYIDSFNLQLLFHPYFFRFGTSLLHLVTFVVGFGAGHHPIGGAVWFDLLYLAVADRVDHCYACLLHFFFDYAQQIHFFILETKLKEENIQILRKSITWLCIKKLSSGTFWNTVKIRGVIQTVMMIYYMHI